MLGERIYCSDTWGNMPIDMSGQNISIVFDLNNEDEVNAVKELEAKAKELGCTITLPLEKKNGLNYLVCSMIHLEFLGY